MVCINRVKEDVSTYFVVVIVTILLTNTEARRSKIRLIDGGYERVVVAIGEEVEENQELIDRIKEVFMRIGRLCIQPQSNIPYVNKPTGCGQPGLYLHITPEYILNENVGTLFGPYDKTLTHEWAHLRWGVFDEYPLQGDRKFYAASDGSIQGTRCVLAIEGDWRRLNGRRCTAGNDGFPEEQDCYFADKLEPGKHGASLMYRQYLEGLETFCDSSEYVGSWEGGLHNSEAPNKQNKLCDGKSIWEVMREHPDFADYDTRIVEGVYNATPTFKIVKKESTRTVIVMDVSGSMHGEKIRLLRAAVYNLLNLVLRKGHQVGLVAFSHKSVVLANLTETDEEGKAMLLDRLPEPERIGGGTSIAKGVYEALAVLANGHGSAAGGKLLVITDGRETSHPKLQRLTDQDLEGVVVDTIAVGPSADPSLEQLAQRTGGQSYYHLDGTSDIIGAFSAQSAAQRTGTGDLESVPITIILQTIGAGETVSVPFIVDKSTSGCLSVILTSLYWNSMNAWLKSPTGVVIDRYSKQYRNVSQFDLFSFELEKDVTEGEIPISVSAEWAYTEVKPPQNQILYATVARGYVPVINCQVEATVEFSNQSTGVATTLQLLDNGSGADIRVKNKGMETKIANGALVGFGAAVHPALSEEDFGLDLQDTGAFQRHTVGNSFTCTDDELCKEDAVDVYAPAKITDLVATNVDFDLHQLNLTFTAPGDDLAQGTGGSFSYFFAVIAVDDEGNRGPTSNFASSSFRDFRPVGSSWFIWIIITIAVILFIMLNIVAVLLVCACLKSATGKQDKYNVKNYQSVPGDGGEETVGLKAARHIDGPTNC
ncbi:putative epithelial chloride channel protein-like [Apostichopus japonicus]|uniref:Putative epithelial chloride channel protein-like n=1 Tax=Stichopus japonicus TaxID=307972 RepID=A0A2G8KUV3_STIJA|nr:putative epithelial chloride channel protein-like [Apostichopus japonicus]